MKNRYTILVVLVAGILAVFIARAVLADDFAALQTFAVFDTLTVGGALLVILRYQRDLRRSDWVLALVLGAVVGVGMLSATLFSPYPFLGLVRSVAGQALLRGLLTALATLGGLAIMRQGGPVQFHIANGEWRTAGRGVLLGLVVGLPLAALNVFALRLTQGRPLAWQHPLAALLDALQPAVLEEVIYRFTLWGLLWLLLRRPLPRGSVWLAGVIALLVHNYAHFDDLFVHAPLTALAMGAVLALFWGLPPLVLARRRGLESAVAFHWLQDAARFVVGF